MKIGLVCLPQCLGPCNSITCIWHLSVVRKSRFIAKVKFSQSRKNFEDVNEMISRVHKKEDLQDHNLVTHELLRI